MAPRGRVSVYRPQLRVPVFQATHIPELDVSSGIARGADEVGAAIDRVQRQEAQTWTAMQVASARRQWTEQITKAHEEGSINDGFAQKSEEDFKTYAQEAVKSAPNQYARQAIELGFADLQNDIYLRAGEFEARARTTRIVGQAEQTLNDWGNIVATDPGQFKKAWEETGAVIGGLKVPTEVRQKLDLARRGLAENALNTMAEKEPGRVIRELDAGSWNDYIDADRRKVLYNSAQAEQRRRVSEAKANAAQARAENYQDAIDLAQSDLLSRKMTGKGVDPKAQATIRAGFTDKQWDKYQSATEQADTFFKVNGDLRTLPLSEIYGIVEKQKPVAGDPDFAPKQAAYQAAVAARDDVLKDRKNDPGASVRESFPKVASAWRIYETSGQDANLRDALKASQAAQTSVGIADADQALLPDRMAEHIAGQIANSDAQTAGKALRSYADKFGPYWKKVYAQISPKLDPAVMVAATLDDERAAALMLDTSRQPREKVRAAVGVKENEMSDAISSDPRFQDFREAMGPYGVNNNSTLAVAQAAETQALGYMATTNVDKSKAVDMALNDILKKYQSTNLNGRTFIVPKIDAKTGMAIDARRIQSGAAQILRTLDVSKFDLADSGVPGSLKEDERQAFQDGLRRQGYFVTSPGAVGLTLYGPRGAITKYGKPVTFTWDEIAEKPGANSNWQGGRYGFEPLR